VRERGREGKRGEGEGCHRARKKGGKNTSPSILHCNTLQHNATHCNTLQHAAIRCNTLQHAAKHCNTADMESKRKRRTKHLIFIWLHSVESGEDS